MCIRDRYSAPDDLDVVSIDVDGQDFWIWMALKFTPVLYVIEYNSNFPSLHQTCTVQFDPHFRWDGSKYYGASLGALVKLGRDKSYTLVYANTVNAFFVHDEYLGNPEDFVAENLNRPMDMHPPDPLNRRWIDV